MLGLWKGGFLLGDPPEVEGVGAGLSTFVTNVREWHFVQHSYGASTLRVPHDLSDSSDLSDPSDMSDPGIAPRMSYRPGEEGE